MVIFPHIKVIFSGLNIYNLKALNKKARTSMRNNSSSYPRLLSVYKECFSNPLFNLEEIYEDFQDWKGGNLYPEAEELYQKSLDAYKGNSIVLN